MNACLRAVVRTALYRGLKIDGILRGYMGMIENDIRPLEADSVSGIIQHGGTFLKTSRCDEFLKPEGRARAAERLKAAGIEGLAAIGGDGTFRGAHQLWLEHEIPVIGIPGTIDNDLCGTDYTLGYDTAVNTALEAIDKIRDTASSHERLFFVEVMGRHSGFIALDAAAAGGAEAVVIPESCEGAQELARLLEYGRKRGKHSMIFVVAEGDECGGAAGLAEKVSALTGSDYRISILGHIQRGGAPTARDSVLACKLGAAAVEALLQGETDKMVGEIKGEICLTPLPQTWQKKKPLDTRLLELVRILST
jgi:6-phosphofructokinase 1